jgi:hypothetical protein
MTMESSSGSTAYVDLRLRKQITIGPFSLFFTNVNSEMKIAGHSHFATLELTFDTLGRHGFPAFAETYAVIQDAIKAHTLKPFRDYKNEDVADSFFALFHDPALYLVEPFSKWGGAYELASIRLGVRGVPDRIGHADGFTFYQVTKSD